MDINQCSSLLIKVNHGFQNKTIPEIFGNLPSLHGIFLGKLRFHFMTFSTKNLPETLIVFISRYF